MKWYLTAIKNSFEFYKRSRRKEFWMYMFWSLAILLFLVYIDTTYGFSYNQKVAAGLFMFASVVPIFGLIIRRLHDIGKSSWYFFVIFVPFVNVVFLLGLMLMDSQRGRNEYGDNPKGIGNTPPISNNDILDDGNIFLTMDDM